MKVLYYILVACLLVMLGTALAAYVRVQRHRRKSNEDDNP
jgi:hypothetical protein